MSVDSEFELFWKSYPKRIRPDDKAIARRKFHEWVQKGVSPQQIVYGAKAYADAARDLVGTSYIKMAKTWLNNECWKDYEQATADKLKGLDDVAARHGYKWDGERYVKMGA